MGVMVIEPRPGRIPFSAIDGYARRYRIAGAGFDLLSLLIEKLDDAFLAFDAERAKEAQGSR